MKVLILFISTAIPFFLLDLIWLGIVGKGLYKEYLGHILSEKINWIAALVFYFVYISGIIYFVISPALKIRKHASAFYNGAILGFLCYVTYDFTNMATIQVWPLQIVIIDIAWGVFLTSFSSWCAYFLSIYSFKKLKISFPKK